jgi:AcrR family transcriptional regulator
MQPAASDQKTKAADKRDLIRSAAFRCFARSGYHQTTVDDICRAAGISKGSYYWHYESKQSVFLELLDEWARMVEDELRSQLEAALGNEAPYAAMTRALGELARRQRRLLPVWMDFISQGSRDREIRAGLATFHRRIRESLTTLLRPVLGTIADDDLRALTGSMLACFVGLVCQDLVDPDEAAFDKQLRIFMNTLERLVQQACFGRRSHADHHAAQAAEGNPR